MIDEAVLMVNVIEELELIATLVICRSMNCDATELRVTATGRLLYTTLPGGSWMMDYCVALFCFTVTLAYPTMI